MILVEAYIYHILNCSIHNQKHIIFAYELVGQTCIYVVPAGHGQMRDMGFLRRGGGGVDGFDVIGNTSSIAIANIRLVYSTLYLVD